jgi:hypothetical protein
MMIDDGTLKQSLRINDELLQLRKCLNERPDTEFSFRQEQTPLTTTIAES